MARSTSSSVKSTSSGSAMAKAPYPGFSPSYRVVETLGGMQRQVWVLEICTDDGLLPARMAQLEDEISMLIEVKFPEVRVNKVVRSDQFDTELRRAMRIT